jgi:hypothetical protein
MMRRWLSWIKGDGLLSSTNPGAVIGRLILSAWISIIAICALIVGGIFVVHPESFSTPKHDTTCFTVEHNGEAIDSCEFLTP